MSWLELIAVCFVSFCFMLASMVWSFVWLEAKHPGWLDRDDEIEIKNEKHTPKEREFSRL